MMTVRKPLYVGIGTSSAAAEVLSAFVRSLSDAEGMAFIVLAEGEAADDLRGAIAGIGTLHVMIADQSQRLESGTVYIVPEGLGAVLDDDRLQLLPEDAPESQQGRLDHFFTSLAEAQRENSVGVILSGEGSDGTIGAKMIKERGGITIAKVGNGTAPGESEMAQSAISSGLVDFAEVIERIPERLMQIRDGIGVLDLLVDDETGAQQDEELRQIQQEVAQLLRSHSGHDFSGYKPRTFMRRVVRRMKVRQLDDMDDYLQKLQDDPAEVMALFRDLLINVTNFFRDEDAFEALEQRVLPHLFEGRGADETIRVWVPGCATGEEVYSIGILMREYMDRMPARPKVQIFATDIDEEALSAARAGRYPEAILASVSPERRERFFRRDGTDYVVRKDVREMCIFSPHSVISDPPFSRMDLVSCRNLLIYFGPDLQNQAVPTFHYALKPGGFLFLGTSEGVGRHGDLFAAVDKHHRIYQSRDIPGRPNRLPMAMEANSIPVGHGNGRRSAVRPAGQQLRQRVEQQVLERHAPPHVVIAHDGEILFFSAGTGRFLEMPRGAPNRQLQELARRELRADLRSAQREAMETAATCRRRALLEEGESTPPVAVELVIEPLGGPGAVEPLFLVLFKVLGTRASAPGEDDGSTEKREAEAALEREVMDLRERMQSTVEEYETALEELKASNEELVSVNEEAQSTNEELEASKEEMQSLNQELRTINMELATHVEELDRAGVDQKNLYAATEIATVFLDGDLVITNFTPAAASFFNLRGSDLGRPLTDLVGALHYPELEDHVRSVFDTGETIERRVSSDADDTHHLVRLMPYRNGDDNIEGVVVTIVDITTLAKAEAQQKVLISELNHRVKNMLTVVISIANSTKRAAPTPEEFASKLISRLHGMARAYALLSDANWSKVCIDDLVHQEGEAFGRSRLIVDGPHTLLDPHKAMPFGMIIHELATNSAKYGALSTDEGRVRVSWDHADGRVSLEWRETGGPKVEAPATAGFGMILIDGQVTEHLGGEIAFDFAPEGLIVSLVFPDTD